jgi:hypothetical protein
MDGGGTNMKRMTLVGMMGAGLLMSGAILTAQARNGDGGQGQGQGKGMHHGACDGTGPRAGTSGCPMTQQ